MFVVYNFFLHNIFCFAEPREIYYGFPLLMPLKIEYTES